jgi:hypothetical protein
MKLISASIAFAAVSADLISYRLQESVTEMASLFLSDSTFAAQLFNHGCWCAKIADQGPTSATLGGNQPVDELDQICKDWARARRCSRAAGSSCESADFTSTYEIELSPQSCVDSDACLSETCQIDFSFVSAIEAWRNSNSGTFSPVTNPVCPAHTTSQMNNCVDFVTTPAPTASAEENAVADALLDAGVDNSDKQLAMTLVWFRDCDLDIHAFQPDGAEIYYSNEGPLSSTGRLDTDTSQVNSAGLAVENIAWISAPSGEYTVAVKNYGYCSPGVDYKLYVQIDGVMSVFERVAPAGDNGKYSVLTFDYVNPNGRSVQAGVEFTSEVALLADEDEAKN